LLDSVRISDYDLVISLGILTSQRESLFLGLKEENIHAIINNMLHLSGSHIQYERLLLDL